MNFESFLMDAGLIPGDIIRGRWVRVPTETHPRKRNGSYKLVDDGSIGWAQNFEGGDVLTWRPSGSGTGRAVDRAEIARRLQAAHRRQTTAIQAAREFYHACQPLRGGHPYLEAHGLSMNGCLGLKKDKEGWLVVPVFGPRDLISVQRIAPAGEKLFWPGAPVKSGFYTINRPAAAITVLCEGLATGLAIFAAAPLTRIVVSFNAGNLGQVAASIPRRGLVTIAADNDHGTASRIGTNPGLDAARAASVFLGCGVAVPEGITGTDWCDLRRERAETYAAAHPKARDGDARRAVDAQIASEISRNAVFLTNRPCA